MRAPLAVAVAAVAAFSWEAPLRAQSGGDAELVRLRQENRVAEVELDRLRQVIARLEAELAAVREELERARSAGTRRSEAEDGELARPPDSATGSNSVAVADPPVEEEDLTDEELGAPVDEEPAADRPEGEEPARASPGPGAEAPAETSEAARALYDESYTLFHEKRYAESEAGFRRFLGLYPDGDLADNAQFWIGECRYALGEYDGALQAFLATVESYPDGNKVPDALYKAGRSLESLGERDKARATYEEVGRLFPSSAAALAARERLADLR